MKKLIALILAAVLCLGVLAGCEKAPEAPVVDALANAKSYLHTMYKDTPETTPTDYTVVGMVVIGGTTFEVEWTADSDTIKITRGEDKMVTIDVDEENPEELKYTLTATLKDADGKTASVSFAHKVPAAIIIDGGMSYAEIVDLAYGLEDGLALEDTFRLFGTITKIDTAWSEDYKNITVTIAVAGKEDKPIMCYRLSGEGAKDLKVGDAITVEGKFKNYKGTIEFDAGCVLIGMGEHIDQTAILDAAYALEDGLAMTAPTSLTGVISKIDTEWSDQYNNITVTIICDGKEEQPIMCYRLSGEGAKDLKVGDRITVFGTIKNYKGTIEFDAGCKLIPAEAAAGLKIAAAAYGLEEGLAMTEPATLTGVISNIDTAYNPDYKNVTVTIVIGGVEDYKIMCYRLAGEGADTINVGDTITVTGILKNYKGTIEFDAGCTLDAVK